MNTLIKSKYKCNKSRVYFSNVRGNLIAFMRNRHGRWCARVVKSATFITDSITSKLVQFANKKEIVSFVSAYNQGFIKGTL